MTPGTRLDCTMMTKLLWIVFLLFTVLYLTRTVFGWFYLSVYDATVKFYPSRLHCIDPELKFENLAEQKNFRLAKFYHLFVDPDLVPSPAQRKTITTIISRPPLQELDVEEKLLLWQFRYFLSKKRKGLVKCMKCVDWKSPREKTEALKILYRWETDILTEEALELLGYRFAENIEVRTFAVDNLKGVSNEECLGILLQLVQALRYEKNMCQSELGKFIVQRACSSVEMTCNLHWYCQVEATAGDSHSQMFKKFHDEEFIPGLPREMLDMLKKQEDFMKALGKIYEEVKSGEKKHDRKKKIAKLSGILKEGDFTRELFNNASWQLMQDTTVRLPLDPSLKVKGIKHEKCFIFNSARQPMSISVETTNPNVPVKHIIYKAGDDLRQDQLVIQLINLMDTILKRNGVDCKLTHYNVVATSIDGGLVERVPDCESMSLRDDKKSVQNFLRRYNPSESEPYGIRKEALENYIKSCAGYCVISFILGIRDRHLDNILIIEDGRLFHIDFGHIFGRDPIDRPLAPLMKITQEMVTGIGGENSKGYQHFKSISCSVYNILRKHAALILNLLMLMLHANIPGIVGDGKVDPKMSIMKVQEKFMLNLKDTEAIQYMQNVITDSVGSFSGRLLDWAHEVELLIT